MRTQVAPRTIVVDGVRESHVFTMKVNAKSMLAMAALYSDRPWAVVREYGTNMHDGHVRLKRLRPDAAFIPPEIHLPTKQTPYIMFRDYGIGMDYDTLTRVFTGFFDTLKDDNDEETGGLGLGSKVGFSYAPSFVVESRYDGTLYIASVYRNADGMPQLDLVSQTETTEPNGVSVKIPVPESDFNKFKAPITRLAKYFPMDLTVIGVGEWEKPVPDYAFRGAAWGLTKGHVGHQVIMGNVPYPLDLGQFPDSRREGILFLKGLERNWGSDLYLPIGSADFVPSREALMYTPRTVQLVQDAADKLLHGLRMQVSKAVWKAPNKWEALKALWDASGIVALRPYLKDIMWRGETLSIKGLKLSLLSLTEQMPGLKVFSMVGTGSRFTRGEPYLVRGGQPIKGSETPATDLNLEGAPRLSIEHDEVITLDPETNAVMYIDDLPETAGKWTAQQRVRWDLTKVAETLPQRWRRRRMRANLDTLATSYTFRLTNGVDQEKLIAAFSGFPLQYVSLLEDPPRKKAARSPKGRASVQRFDPDTREFEPVALEDTPSDGLFVRMAMGKLETTTGWEIRNLRSYGITAGILPEDTEIYGIPRSRANVERKEGWKEFIPWMKKQVTPLVATIGKVVAEQRDWSHLSRADVIQFLRTEGVVERLREVRPRSPLLKLWSEYERVVGADDDRVGALRELARMFQISIPVVDLKTSAEDLHSKCYKKHPHLMFVLSHVPSREYDSNREMLIDLIKL